MDKVPLGEQVIILKFSLSFGQLPELHEGIFSRLTTGPLTSCDFLVFLDSRHVLGPFYKSCRAAPNHRNLSSIEVRLGATLLFYKNKTFAMICCAEP